MSKIDLTSKEWCDLVFEGKNKEYGAYELRQDSTRRHYIALIVVIAVSLVLFFLPTLINIVTPKDRVVSNDATEFVDLATPPDEPKDDQPKIEAPPPPPIKSIEFKVFVADKTASKDDDIVTQDSVIKSDKMVSHTSVDSGINFRDLPLEKIPEEFTQVIQEEKPLEFVEQSPQYPGGNKAMMEFIAKQLNYPAPALENGIEGRVYVRFVVSKTGEVSNVEVTKGIHPLCDKEAIRVILMMPKWIPGKNNGSPVPVIYSIPIVFKIAKNG